MKIAAKDLRTRFRRLLEAVERGEDVIITYRGKPRARLVALASERIVEHEELNDTPLFGIWHDREDMEDIEAYLDKLRQGRF